jgi:hypothetical protein
VLAVLKPDGRLHAQSLPVGHGEAVLIRGPTGRTTLIVGGSPNASLLANQVAANLPVWEHQLDSVLVLDEVADSKLALTLGRYPAERRLYADATRRVDLGGGAILDIAGLGPRLSIAFGAVQLGLPDATRGPPWELVSDGAATWQAAASSGQT